ncbi:hypothetical protein [Lacipirellula limnantheis]|uniref:Uncharacterized protein n=1 Tax=Lacipirellula limnantheis TaxID=2528024 RepID=A0A517TXS4_9BACT|nr:hypothetical protein [Lacipirellula limnantheis]QDT73166.1 hypothetical protein I41_23550 [Lacipirellula limnantheis]
MCSCQTRASRAIAFRSSLLIVRGATLNLIFIDGFAPSADDVMKLFRVGGNITGQFSEIKVHNLAAGWTYARYLPG